MRKIGILMIAVGITICLLTPFAFYYLAALGCAMNTTGCSNFSIDWFGADFVAALKFIGSFEALGVGVIVAGYFLRQKHQS